MSAADSDFPQFNDENFAVENGQRPTVFRWVVFALGCNVSLMLYLHRYTFALIKPALIEEFGLDKIQLGYLDSTFSICYTLFQIPLGALSDFAGVHLMLTGMIVFWSIGFGMHAWATRIPILYIARGILGIGQSAVFASLNRLTRTWFPLANRSTMQGILGVFAGRMGGLTSYMLVGFLVLGIWKMEWRLAVYLLAGGGLCLAVLFAIFFRNSPRRHPLVNKEEADLIEGDDPLPDAGAANGSSRMSKREILDRMSVRSVLNLFSLNLQSILSTLADNIYSSWIPLFLFEVHAMKFTEMGFYSALPLLGGAIGGVLGGWLNDYFIRNTGNRRWSRSLVALTGKGLAAFCLLAALLTSYDNPYAFCTMLFFVKLFGDWSLTTSWSTVTDIGGRTTATVFAFNNSVAGIAAIIAPTLYGFVAEEWGWRWMFIIACAAYALCALSWLLIDCTIPILKDDD